MTRIKICCIQNLDEARMAVAAGADALGLVSKMPSGPGEISESTIAQIADNTPPGVATFLLTSHQSAREIIAQQERTRANTLQLVDHVQVAELKKIRDALPAIKIVQVIHVTGEESIKEAASVALLVDAILLDSGNPKLPVKVLGGTGKAHDWSISRRIRDAIAPTPLYLAGGLRPDNVADAIRQVQPFGVDICTGVRSEWQLDPGKLAAFVAAVNSAAV